MLLEIQTSTSDMMKPIRDFRYIYDLARCSKCKYFILLKKTNKLYGIQRDFCSIHEIDIPFIVETDLKFETVDPADKDVLEYEEYFVPEGCNSIIPSIYWIPYITGKLRQIVNETSGRCELIDESGNRLKQIYMTDTPAYYDKIYALFMEQLERFLIRQAIALEAPHVFRNIHQDEQFINAYEAKTADGSFPMRFTNEYIDLSFYFFKGMASVTKSDTLDLEIRLDRFHRNEFVVTFCVNHKKNPLVYNPYGVPFVERIHTAFINPDYLNV